MKVLHYLILCCALAAPCHTRAGVDHNQNLGDTVLPQAKETRTFITQSPVISIITSVYNGNEFIEDFMQDITQQTIFNQCELIMINANSPGNEEAVIRHYMTIYPNIIYRKLDVDPGLYGVWNLAIGMAQGEFLANANIDDYLKSDCYEQFLKTLLQNPSVDLVYADFYITNNAHETFEQCSEKKNPPTRIIHRPEFSEQNMVECLPGNHPMWRKSLHDKYGLFDAQYKSAGDWEMWLRAIASGSVFKKVSGVYGVFYENTNGLSRSMEPSKRLAINTEYQKTVTKYSYLWA